VATRSTQPTEYVDPAYSSKASSAPSSDGVFTTVSSMVRERTGRRVNVASRMIPVRPIPPQVAWKRSGWLARETSRTSPDATRRRSDDTWSVNAPSRWWFLPCTSLAIAPPTVTKRVPGVTGRNQPRGSAVASTSARDTPASQVSSPVLSSKATRWSSPVRSAIRSPSELSP